MHLSIFSQANVLQYSYEVGKDASYAERVAHNLGAVSACHLQKLK